MWFALGFVAGLAASALAAAVVAFLRHPIESAASKILARVELSGPGPRGFILEPESEADEARREHIRRNAEQGKDTPISELL